MGQILHGCAKTTQTIRRAIQNRKESIAKLSKHYNLNPKTIIKWRKRSFTKDADMGPKHPRSTVLTLEEEAIIVTFRKYTLLPLDDCLYALQSTIPHLTRSSLHRCLQRHNISRLPTVDGEVKSKKKFKQYPIGYFHIDIAEVRTEEGKLHLFVAIDRTSKFTYVELCNSATKPIAAEFLRNLIRILPYKIHTILTDNGIQFTNQKRHKYAFQHIFDRVCEENVIEHRLTKVSHPWTNGQVERMNKTLKDATVKKYYYQSHQQLKEHLYNFVMAYNYAKRLKTLKGLTPYEFICYQWTQSPELFILNPHHHTLGPYRAKRLDQKVNESEAERESLLEEKKSLEKKLETAKNRTFEIDNELDKTRNEQEEKLKLEILCLKKQLEERSRFIAKLKMEVDDNKHLELENKGLNDRIETLREVQKALREKKHELSEKVEALNKEKNKLSKEVEELREEQERLHANLDKLQCKIKEVNKEKKNLSKELKEKFEELDEANGLIKNQSFELDGIRKDCNNEVKSLRNSLLERDSQIEDFLKEKEKQVNFAQLLIRCVTDNIEEPIRNNDGKAILDTIQILKSALQGEIARLLPDETPSSSLEDLGYESLFVSRSSTPTKLPNSLLTESYERSQFNQSESICKTQQ